MQKTEFEAINMKTPNGNMPISKVESSAFTFDFSGLGPDVTKIIGRFQNSAQLAPFSKIMKFTHKACQSDLESRYVTEKILPHVFNANPDGIKALFNKEAAPHPKLLLKKTSYQRGYFSKKQNKFVCFEHLKSVSAWQAAYLCGDGPFLGRDILVYLIQDNSLSEKDKRLLVEEARKQLGELIKRIPVKPIANNAVATITTTNVAISVSSAVPATVTIPASPASDPNNMVSHKEKADLNSIATANIENKFSDSFEFLEPVKKLIKACSIYLAKHKLFDSKGNLNRENWVALNKLVSHKERADQNSIATANIENKFSDSFVFLGSVKKLIKAYIIYLAQYKLFDSKGKLSKKNWAVLWRLWELVGEHQKRLPHYFFQEFYGNPDCFSRGSEIKSTFTTPPSRKECRDLLDKLLDLDSLGFCTYKGLIKHADVQSISACGDFMRVYSDGPDGDIILSNLVAFHRLCELREADLRNTFHCLQSLETALTFINNNKTLSDCSSLGVKTSRPVKNFI